MNDWFKEWFGAEYLALYAHRDSREAAKQIDFLLEHVDLAPGARILDIACGPGRHTSELLRRGFSPVSIDLSEALLQRAAEATEGLNAKLVRADMRYLPFADRCFQGALSMFTSFGYFESDAEHLRTLIEWRRVMASGATLVVDVANRAAVHRSLTPHSSKQTRELRFIERRSLSRDGKYVIKNIEVEALQGDSLKQYTERVRLFEESELREMLGAAGFRVLKTFGNFDGMSLSDRAERIVCLAEAK